MCMVMEEKRGEVSLHIHHLCLGVVHTSSLYIPVAGAVALFSAVERWREGVGRIGKEATPYLYKILTCVAQG
jgi:hypothetical protein